jgi:hypothetical protein
MSEYTHNDDINAMFQEAIAKRADALKRLEAVVAELSYTLNELEKELALGF